MKTFVRMALPLALLIAAAPLHSQTTIGVKGGINVANISTSATDLPDVIDSKTGFVGGGFVTFGFGLLAIQPELLYSQKGFKAEELGQTAQLGTNYIEIPVLLKAQFKLAMLRPAIYAGPVVSFETGCNLDVLGVSFSCDDDEGFVDRKTTDWGAAFGANLDFFVGPVTLLLDARYQLGLANLADVADSDESVKNRVWQIMAGVGWTL